VTPETRHFFTTTTVRRRVHHSTKRATTHVTVPPTVPATTPKTAPRVLHAYTPPTPAATFPPAPPPPPPPPPAPAPVIASVPSSGGAEGALIAAINNFRAAHGLPPLSVHPNLSDKARAWAAHMASGGCGMGGNGAPNICHSNLSDGITAQWRLLEENVGMIGPKTNVAGMESAFENSPMHAGNMLNNQINYIGVGVAYVGDYMYVAEEFMLA
jgi:uncharacterized protein YkwD